MHFEGPGFIATIVMICTIGWLVNNWIRAKQGRGNEYALPHGDQPPPCSLRVGVPPGTSGSRHDSTGFRAARAGKSGELVALVYPALALG